jgi:D-glycero-D-manno-heptose 1,7-bisphosphate phosphatase
MSNKAVFLDRDGTLIEDPGYLSDPSAVKLLPGVDLAIKSLRQAGYKVVVVTNQSGVARGKLTEETLEKIHSELRRKLAEKGAALDAIYYCPFHPDGTVPKYARESELRKPAPGMLHKAAEQLDIDLASSWMIGDGDRDVLAGQAAECRTIRVQIPGEASTSDGETEEAEADMTVRNLVDAARVIMRAETEVEAASAAPAPPDSYELEAEKQIAETGLAVPPEIEEDEEAEEVAADTEEPAEVEAGEVSPASAAPPTEMDSEIRKEILRHVRQISKQAETEEFNLANLLGGVTQVLVLLCLLLVFWKMINNQDVMQSILWALVSVVLQTMSLTFFIMARSKR